MNGSTETVENGTGKFVFQTSWFYVLSGLVSFGLSGTFLVLLESRRSTLLEMTRAGLVLYLLIPAVQLFLRRRSSGDRFQPAAFFLERTFSFANLVVLTAALLVTVTCIEGIGYRHRQVVMLVKACFYAFVFFLQISNRSRAGIGVFVILAQLLLPFNSVFFSWNSYIQPAILCAFLLFVYEALRLERKAAPTALHWFDIMVGLYVGLYVLLFPTVDNFQDAFSRLSYFAVLLGLYILIRRFYYGTRRRRDFLRALVILGAIYTLATLLFQLLYVLDLPYGWPIDKSRKGQLITTQIAQHFMCMAPLSLLLIRRGDSKRLRFTVLFVCFASVIVLLMTLARGSIGGLGLSVMACFAGAVLLRHRRLLKYGLALVLLIGLGTGSLFYFSDDTDLTGLFTMRQRLGLWYQSWHIIKQNWLTGTGAFIGFNLFVLQVGDPAYAQLVNEAVIRVAPWIAPHNLYLALLLSGGVFVFLVFGGIFTGAALILARTLTRAGPVRSLQAFLFAVLFLSFPLVGLTESLISTPIPNFLIWLIWTIFAVYFRRELFLLSPRILRGSFAYARLPAGVRGVIRILFLGLLVYFSIGNFLLFQGGVPISALQERIKGLLVLNPNIAGGPDEVRERLDRAERRLLLSRYFLPYDWRPHQLLGEIALVAAAREPARDAERTRRAAEHYQRAIALNPRFSLLWLRLSELYEYHDRRAGKATFAAEHKAALARTTELDPHFAYRRFWANPEAKIE